MRLFPLTLKIGAEMTERQAASLYYPQHQSWGSNTLVCVFKYNIIALLFKAFDDKLVSSVVD